MAANTSGPTWYDILGVDPTASPAEIKAAWRNATDKFEPGTGASQFRLFNEAADVLLDPAKRAEYDAGLNSVDAPAEAAPDPVAEPAETADTPVPEPQVETATPEPPAVEAPAVETSAVEPPAAEPAASELEAPAAEASDYPEPDAAAAPGPSVRLIVSTIVASVLAISMIVVTVALGLHLHKRVDDSNAASDASAVAERALTAVLSFNYLHMDADRNRAVQFLTPAYAKQYVKTFSLLTQGPNGTPGGAEKTQAVVTASVLTTGVVDSNSNTVRVLVFVNQSSVKGSSPAAIFQNRVVATMVRSGDSWLISDITSY